VTDFSGAWVVLSSPDFDYDYLSMQVLPYLTIRHRDNRIEGEYQVGLQYGSILGHVGNENLFYVDFRGNDEMEEAHGSGEGTLEEGRLTFELWHYRGDQYTFECVRRG
jgi:hypothetical protein